MTAETILVLEAMENHQLARDHFDYKLNVIRTKRRLREFKDRDTVDKLAYDDLHEAVIEFHDSLYDTQDMLLEALRDIDNRIYHEKKELKRAISCVLVPELTGLVLECFGGDHVTDFRGTIYQLEQTQVYCDQDLENVYQQYLD